MGAIVKPIKAIPIPIVDQRKSLIYSLLPMPMASPATVCSHSRFSTATVYTPGSTRSVPSCETAGQGFPGIAVERRGEERGERTSATVAAPGFPAGSLSSTRADSAGSRKTFSKAKS